MKRKSLYIICLVAGIFWLNPSFIYSQKIVRKNKIPTVSVCQINKQPMKYEAKIVRIIGTYAANFERLTIYDASCKKVEKSIEFLPDCNNQIECEEFNKRLYKHIKGNLVDGLFVNIVAVGLIEVRNVPKESNENNVVIHIKILEKTSPIDN